MKKLLFPLIFGALSILSLPFKAQEHACSKAKQKMLAARFAQAPQAQSASPQISHELKYDVKFVHLNLFLERNTKYIKGGVTTVAKVSAAVLDTFQTLLHQNHTIDSVRFNGALLSILRQDSMVKIKPPVALPNGTNFTVTIYYKGTSPNGGSAIGAGYDTDVDPNYGNEVTWSLSESFVAYQWWPCKQILTDKIDSSWVFVTTDSTNKVGSNGRLKNVVTIGNKKRYEWKSRNPIDYYLISVAIAKYKEYNLYAKPQYLINDSILIQNYIYDNAINDLNWIMYEKTSLNLMPAVMSFFCEKFGMYPFYKEKYGHCMAYFGGAMEHQTMTTTFGFEFFIAAHELGHQWWGDNVTCKSWGDIWINEGFAVYSEILVAEAMTPTYFPQKLNDYHNNVMGQSGGSIYFTNQDTLNTPRIFDSRLTYDKGGSILHTLRFLTNNDSLWFNTLRGFQSTYKNSNATTVDFKNYYQTQTGINATQFFNQWYYGQGFPIFAVRYNFGNGVFYLKSSQTVSMPSVTPLFITPMEYKIKRTGMADTIIRVQHNVAVENYSFALSGTVTGVVCDPNNWVINKVSGPSRDFTLGIDATTSIKTSEDMYSQISIGPNPNDGNLHVSNPANVSGAIFVYDLTGRLLIKQLLKEDSSVDLSPFAKGLYLVEIADANGNIKLQNKILKE